MADLRYTEEFGEQLKWRGDYRAGQVYNKGDVVRHTNTLLWRARLKTHDFAPPSEFTLTDLVWDAVSDAPASAAALSIVNHDADGLEVTAGGATNAVLLGADADSAGLMTAADKIKLDAAPYDVGFFLAGQPGDGATVVAFKFVRAATFADDFAGSEAHVETNPTDVAEFDVQKNGASIGSVSISTGGVATFATTAGAVSFAVGDRLTVVAPSPQDATLVDVTVVFKGQRE